MHLQTCSVTASGCISQFTQSRTPIASPNRLDHGLKVHLSVLSTSACKCISKLAWSRPQTASLSVVNLGLQVHLYTHSIMASQCISEFAQSRSRIPSSNQLDHCLREYLWDHSIVIFRRTSNFSQAPPAASPDRPCVDGLLYRYIHTSIRIQTEYMSFENHWTIGSSYDLHAHQQHSQRRCSFSQTALLWFEVLPDMSPALPGTPWLVVGAPSYSEGRQECPPRVWYSPEIDASKFALPMLSDTPGGFQWQRYILLMLCNGKRVILRERVRGSVRAVRAVRNT